jgi:two-component system response regulator MprA
MNSILIVEDAPNFLRWIAAAIARHGPGLEVRTASTAWEAERSLAAAPPSAVVLDLALPKLHVGEPPSTEVGLALLRRLRRGPNPIPTVVMSSHAAEQESLTAGASAFVSKSSPNVLHELLLALGFPTAGGTA